MKINKEEILSSTISLNVLSNRPTKMFDENNNFNIGHYFTFYRRFELNVIDHDREGKLVYKGKSKKDLWNHIQSLIEKAREAENAFDGVQKIRSKRSKESKDGTRFALMFKGRVVKFITQEEYKNFKQEEQEWKNL